MPAKPLRSKLLAVPALRARYLSYVSEIAERWLDWQTLEPVARRTTRSSQTLSGQIPGSSTRFKPSNRVSARGARA